MATSYRRQRRESLRTRLSTWSIKITSFSLNNFAPEEFFGGAKSVSMNGPKFSKSDRTMKAFSFVVADYISCYLYEYLLYIPIPLSIPIPIPIPIYVYLYEALVCLTEVLVWLTQAPVCKSAVCKCRTPRQDYSFVYFRRRPKCLEGFLYVCGRLLLEREIFTHLFRLFILSLRLCRVCSRS